MTTRPELPSDVVIAEDAALDDLWQRFEIFEALHHTMDICNPMSPTDLDAVVNALAAEDGHTVLDIACGYGELLFRLAEQATITGTGLDLSPWMIAGAAARSHRRVPEADLQWVIGEGRTYGVHTQTSGVHTQTSGVHTQTSGVHTQWDRTCCLGASWIWQGMPGTIREAVSRTAPGGRFAVGDLRLRDGCDPNDVTLTHGRVFTADEAETLLHQSGAELVTRVDTTDASWEAYLDRTRVAAEAWQSLHPGPDADRYIEEQKEWVPAHARDQEILTWSVWVAVRSPES